jgi:hypothetical protein
MDGEISNGDNLIEIYDSNVANYYVIVAIWLLTITNSETSQKTAHQAND